MRIWLDSTYPPPTIEYTWLKSTNELKDWISRCNNNLRITNDNNLWNIEEISFDFLDELDESFKKYKCVEHSAR